MSERSAGTPGPASRGNDRDERVGVFPSWGWLYVTVIVYGALLILLLYILTIVLDFGSP